jgi:hypothetical protein
MGKEAKKQIAGNVLTGALILLCTGLGVKFLWTAKTQADGFYVVLALAWLVCAAVWARRLVRDLRKRHESKECTEETT